MRPRRAHTFFAALRRRFWLLALCVLAVTGAVVAVSRLQQGSYTASATIYVPPSFGPSTPGNPDSAKSLAGTYERVIGTDDAVARAVAERLHTTPGRVRNNIAVFQSGGTALLRVRFTAPSSARALSGAKALADVLTSPLPSSSAIAQGTLQLSSLPTHATRAAGQSAADALLVVSSGAGPADPGNADAANRLAQTYAGILESDSTLRGVVAHKVGESADQVASAMSVTIHQDTSLLTVNFRASSAQKAADGAKATASAVTGSHPATPNVAAGSLAVLNLPKPETRAAAAHSLKTAVPLGVGLGLLLGLVLLVARERADRRIDGPDDLAAEADCPATSLDHLAPDALEVLLQRWRTLSGEESRTLAALIPAGKRGSRAARTAAATLARRQVANGNGHAVEVEVGGNGYTPKDVVIVPPSEEGAWERIALSSDLAVVVTTVGSRAEEIREVADQLRNLGIEPAWALLDSGRRPQNV